MPVPTPSPGLDLATFEEILAELQRRYKSLLVVTVESPQKADDDMDIVMVRTFGGQISGLGLARYADRAITDLIMSQED